MLWGVPQRAAVSTYHTVTLALIALSGAPRYGNRIKKIQTVERQRLDVAEAARRVFFMGCSKCITELFYILQPPLYFRATSLILLPFRSELACLSAGGDVAARRRNLIWSLEKMVGLSWRNILASSGLVNMKFVGWESWHHLFSQMVKYWEIGILENWCLNIKLYYLYCGVTKDSIFHCRHSILEATAHCYNNHEAVLLTWRLFSLNLAAFQLLVLAAASNKSL